MRNSSGLNLNEFGNVVNTGGSSLEFLFVTTRNDAGPQEEAGASMFILHMPGMRYAFILTLLPLSPLTTESDIWESEENKNLN